jgi:hypothetical protein
MWNSKKVTSASTSNLVTISAPLNIKKARLAENDLKR